VPVNSVDDVYSSGGWVSGFPLEESSKFIGAPIPKIYGPGSTFYRLHNGFIEGKWWTLSLPISEVQFRIDSAHLPTWGKVNYMSTYTIPEGSFVQGWEGPAEYQGGFYVGGSTQVYLPHINTQWTTTGQFPP
jgi:hypothetical protein